MKSKTKAIKIEKISLGKMNKRGLTLVLGILLLIVLIGALIVYLSLKQNPIIVPNAQEGLQYFNSLEEITNYVNESRAGIYGYGQETAMTKAAVGAPQAAGDSATASAESSQRASSYSQTNIQVEGVDEPDVIKNDGKYIYTLSNGKLTIVEAYPPTNMKIVYTTGNASDYASGNHIQNIFLKGDKLVTFSNGYETIETGVRCPEPYYDNALIEKGVDVDSYYPGDCEGYSRQLTYVRVYDISDKSNPRLEENVSIEGFYNDARMIGDYVYTITSKSVNLYHGNVGVEPPIYKIDGVEVPTSPSDVAYFGGIYDNSYTFTSVSSLNIQNGNFDRKVYLLGSSGRIYVSENNIYLTSIKYLSSKYSLEKYTNDVVLPLLPSNKAEKVREISNSDKTLWEKGTKINEILQDHIESISVEEKAQFSEELEKKLIKYQEDIARESQKTVIHKINVNKDRISFIASGEVPGNILNQFSMDEHESNFRIATTTGEVWREGSTSKNHLFILNKDLEIIGRVENLAPGERIYSVRFMGDKAYIVTFKKVDPLFVIDVSDPQSPKVLGYLKITGFSDYLHPYDETHIIGVGKETRGGNEHFSWYQGLKISLFDVSDFENPREVAKIEIGDRGTESDVFYDHKAFVFDKEKSILILPVNLHEIDENASQEQISLRNQDPDSVYGTEVWQGAYVLNIDENNISIRGRITHRENSEKQCSQGWQGREYCYWDYNSNVRRALWMDNVVYTISNNKIKAHDLTTVEELNQIDLPRIQQQVYGQFG